MSRAGRKRKAGNREKNGRVQRERGIDQNLAASEMPHRTAEVCYLSLRRAIPCDKRHDPKAEHPLGRLNLVGAISDAQYDAGCRFRDEVIRYRRGMDGGEKGDSVGGVWEA